MCCMHAACHTEIFQTKELVQPVCSLRSRTFSSSRVPLKFQTRNYQLLLKPKTLDVRLKKGQPWSSCRFQATTGKGPHTPPLVHLLRIFGLSKGLADPRWFSSTNPPSFLPIKQLYLLWGTLL